MSPSARLRAVTACALLLPLLAGCQSPAPAAPARAGNPGVVARCRAETDRAYAAQNRVDLTRQDDRNEPFAAAYVSGIVTRGLGARYGRDKMVDSCVRAAGGPAQVPDLGAAPTFNPGMSRQ